MMKWGKDSYAARSKSGAVPSLEQEAVVEDEVDNDSSLPLKVLFLSSDTGGGHRASAQALADQFLRLYPNSTFEIIDVISQFSTPPFDRMEKWYQHLCANPSQWKVLFQISNNRLGEGMVRTHLSFVCEASMRRRIADLNPDVVVNVHPLMSGVPSLACERLNEARGVYVPIFTVVTDLASAHRLWFDGCRQRIERVFVASEDLERLAIQSCHVPPARIVRSGLPIRQEFAEAAQQLAAGDRALVRRCVRAELGLPTQDHHRVVLLMAGGEGLGSSLSSLVNSFFVEVLLSSTISATLIVVCGRNAALRAELTSRDWDSLEREAQRKVARRALYRAVTARLRSLLKLSPEEGGQENGDSLEAPQELQSHPQPQEHGAALSDVGSSPRSHESFADLGMYDSDGKSSVIYEANTQTPSSFAVHSSPSPTLVTAFPSHAPGEGQQTVSVLPLGYVTTMAKYMVASDVLVTKAGPGTIAEAAAVGLPVMLTSFLPGQEEGNVEFVVNRKFGDYLSDKDPDRVARRVVSWLQDSSVLQTLSTNAAAVGRPSAAEDIVRMMGTSALRWKEAQDGI